MTTIKSATIDGLRCSDHLETSFTLHNHPEGYRPFSGNKEPATKQSNKQIGNDRELSAGNVHNEKVKFETVDQGPAVE